MGTRFGETNARPVDSIRTASPLELEFILADEAGADVQPVKRGRGRPRKNPRPVVDPSQPKRGRGRPRKNTPTDVEKGEKNAPDVAAVDSQTEKRGRARSMSTPGTRVKPVTALSDYQIDDATDRVIMGERIAVVAADLNVSAKALAVKIKKRCGMLYMRRWQQSIAYDCLRAELLLKRSMLGASESEDPRWLANGLKVLEYRARVLGFGAVNPQEQTLRVAGMTQEAVFDAILEKL